ncbi:WXG100 family type VII secretion target [Mycobacterium sp.]|uniref:WXG100 family type VII secretion target n=1 Tax=Mycobacterium sp. TaxID=1785 RepID=UPI002C52F498|nr:WXG100 family type VII secretion target [Mycobacterium sp.]HKP39630.1 WXG100 family type VII secretion target [Mycobacterium sp.]
MRYRVELEELLAFVDRLQSFEQRAEAIAARVDGQIAGLHEMWAGSAATAHRAQHDEWMSGAAQMREAVAELRAAAHNAHQHYTDAARLNVEMLS